MTENEAIKRVEEFGLHHAIGDLPNSVLTVKSFEMAIEALREIQQYRAIGTVEECREAREKQRAKKPIIKSKKKTKIQTGDYVDVKCPCCEEDIFSCFHYPPWNDSQKSHKHCENCGQAIDWGDTD